MNNLPNQDHFDIGRFCQINDLDPDRYNRRGKLDGRTGLIVGLRSFGPDIYASVKIAKRNGAVVKSSPQYLVATNRLLISA